MTTHPVGTREAWLAARLELLEAEKALSRQTDAVARQRQALPWVPVEKDYRFMTEDGEASLADLFRGNSQLLVYHFMFGPDYTAGCPACSAIADGFDRSHVHLANHDVTLMAISAAPIEKLLSYRERMGWTFPWASSVDSDFNYDFHTSQTVEQQQSGSAEYNFREEDTSWVKEGAAGPTTFAEMTGTDVAGYVRQRPGVSAFALQDGIVHHTYSSYARGLDATWAMYQWLDRAPLGRNETDLWFRRRDEY